MSDNPLQAEWLPPDYSRFYNTTLTPEQERKFQADMGDRLRDLSDYDLRGAWLADAKAAANGHLPDTWKKPNHPTFSVESQYASKQIPGGRWIQLPGGETSFVPSMLTLSLYGPDNLRRYFASREPDTFLDLRQIEKLPGITTLPGKPSGLDRSQLPPNRLAAPSGSTDSAWVQNLKKFVQPNVDPRAVLPPSYPDMDPRINYLSPRIGDDRDV